MGLEERIAALEKVGTDEDFAKAIELAEEVLAIRLEHQGPGSGWTMVDGEPAEWWEVGDARRRIEDLKLRASLSLESRSELAEAEADTIKVGELYGQGQYDKALELTRRQLEILHRLVGNEHQDVALILNNLALFLKAKGDYEAAESLYREALTMNRKLLGDVHPNVALNLSNLGVLLWEKGNYAAAEPLYRESLAMYRRLLGDEHLDVARGLNNLAGLLERKGDYVAAEPLYREALVMLRKLLGDEHPHVARLLNNLAMITYDKGDYAAAEPLSRQALVLYRKLLGDEHPDVAECMSNLGGFLYSKGDYAAAEPLYREALAMYSKLLGDEHPHVAKSLHNLADLLSDKGDYAAAEPLYREALAMNRRLLGDEHPRVATNMNNLAWLLGVKGDYAAAEPLYREALAMNRRLLGDEHPSVANNLNNLADLLSDKGDYAAAEPLYRGALAMNRSLLGDEHPNVALNLNNLGGMLYAKGNHPAAEKVWTAAAESFEAARLRADFGGLERVQFTAQRSPLMSLAVCRARIDKPLPAWESQEASLARGLLDTVSARESRPLDESERNREYGLIRRLSKIDERISTILKATEGTDEHRTRVEELRNERQARQVELDRFEAEMVAKYGAVAGEVYELSHVQSNLSADEALLAWVDIKGDPNANDPNGDHWACLVKKVGDPIWVQLPGSGKDGTWTNGDDELAHRVRQELCLWAPRSTAHYRAPLFRRLHAQRIKSVEEHLSGIRHLIILPAGKMAGIPLEVLTDDFTISYAPSGTMYAWLRKKTTQMRPKVEGSGFLLALGDPVFPQPSKSEMPLSEPPDHGVLIAMVAPDSNALRSGLEAGDVLLTYGGAELGGPDDLGPAIQKAQEQTPESIDGLRSTSEFPVSVWREGKTLELAVAPGRLGIRPAQQPAPEAILTQRRLDAVMASTRGRSFSPIPHTRQEVKVLAELFKPGSEAAETDTPKDSPLILLGSEASEQRLDALAEAGELRKFRYLHLATHGEMDDKIAMNSAMILSQDNLPDTFEQAVAGKEVFDGRLTAEQIVRTWKLDADLVTLSGCETALGEESGGEGFLGFSQALFVAGARSLLLSLWKVDDRATMLLMKRFYENMLGKYDEPRSIPNRKYEPGTSMHKADALREAKIWLRHLTADQVKELDSHYRGQSVADVSLKPETETAPATHHPYEDPQYWASFILIGDPD